MNCDIDIKHEEDPLPRTDFKTEPHVKYKFYILCFVLSCHNLVIDTVEPRYSELMRGCDLFGLSEKTNVLRQIQLQDFQPQCKAP